MNPSVITVGICLYLSRSHEYESAFGPGGTCAPLDAARAIIPPWLIPLLLPQRKGGGG